MKSRIGTLVQVVVSVHLLLGGVQLSEGGPIVYDDNEDIVWVTEHCVESIQDNDVYEVEERQDQFGCWPEDPKKPNPGPPTNLTVEVVYTNQSGFCSAVLHISWNAPTIRVAKLTGFSLTLISVDLLPRAPCVTISEKSAKSIQHNAYNTTFSYNCLMLPFDIGFTVIVDSLPRSSTNPNSISSQLVTARSTDEQCQSSTQPSFPSSSTNISSARVEKLQSPVAPSFIRHFTGSDLAIIIPLTLIGLTLVVLTALYIGCYRRRQSQATESSIHEPSSTICVCARCQLERSPAFLPPDKVHLIQHSNPAFSRSPSSYSCESV